MSIECGVQWSSLGGNVVDQPPNQPLPSSSLPSISLSCRSPLVTYENSDDNSSSAVIPPLPPLPDLIPIRKGCGTNKSAVSTTGTTLDVVRGLTNNLSNNNNDTSFNSITLLSVNPQKNPPPPTISPVKVKPLCQSPICEDELLEHQSMGVPWDIQKEPHTPPLNPARDSGYGESIQYDENETVGVHYDDDDEHDCKNIIVKEELKEHKDEENNDTLDVTNTFGICCADAKNCPNSLPVLSSSPLSSSLSLLSSPTTIATKTQETSTLLSVPCEYKASVNSNCNGKLSPFPEQVRENTNTTSLSCAIKRSNDHTISIRSTHRRAVPRRSYCESRLYLEGFNVSIAAARKRTANGRRKGGNGTARGRAASYQPKRTHFVRAKQRYQSPCFDADGNKVPRVNPIFLFVKQEDTRIVEVRCEDYDKRNRIRLTKTANGWRATPRTDTTSSIVASLLPKVIVTKKERDEADEANMQWHKPVEDIYTSSSVESESPNNIIKLCKSTTDDEANDFNSHKKKKKKKKKKKRRKERERVEEEYETVKTKSDESFIMESNGCNSSSCASQISSHSTANNTIPLHTSTSSISTTHEQHIDEQAAPLLNLLAADSVGEMEFNANVKCTISERTFSSPLSSPHRLPSFPPPPSPPSPMKNACDDVVVKDDEMLHRQVDPGNIDMGSNGIVATSSENNIEIAIEAEEQQQQQPAKADSLEVECPDTNADAVVFETTSFGSKSVCTVEDQSAIVAEAISPTEIKTVEEVPIIVPDEDDENEETHFVPDVVVCESNHQLNEYHDLIEGIPNIQVAHSEDILDHCDNTMTGAELLDSLVEQSCEDNHISGEEDIKHTICLTDDYNEDDDVLLENQPVADIISRLGDSLGSSPKCLSFNEVGEIEALHESLFETSQTDLNAVSLSDNITPFNRSALEELSMTLKDLEKRSTEQQQLQQQQQQQHDKQPVESTIVSPDSCQEELPKDLSFKKNNEAIQIVRHSSPRPISRDSDAIQSPQPSGLPAVPPSPDIIINNLNKHHSKPLFLDLSSPSPKLVDSRTSQEKTTFIDLVSPLPKQQTPVRTQQKEPLDLGKHRKSASPTVSCSEEAKRSQQASELESLPKRIKSEHPEKILPSPSSNGILDQQTKTSQLVEMLASGKDPDPLTQLRLLIRNPEWKLPDPILVPKDRLNAVLASPAREIPLLLTTRPELRLPEAFAFPSILQDPDILVISFAQLESILQKQDDLLKSSKPSPKPDKRHTEKSLDSPRSRTADKMQSKAPATPTTPMGPLLANGLAGDIDAATMAAFNQMLWLPYLGQMGQMNPDIFKAMSGFANTTAMQDPLQQFTNQGRYPNFQSHTPVGYGNPLDFALWQDALAQANNANMQRVMKMNVERESQKKNIDLKPQIHQQNRQTHHGQQFSLQSAQPHQQQKLGHMLNSMSQMGIPPFFQSSLANMSNLTNSNRYYGNSQRSQQQQQLVGNVSQYSPGFRQSPQQISNPSDHLTRSSCAQASNKQSHSLNHSMTSPPNPFFPPQLSNLPDYSMNRSKSRKESFHHQQHHNSGGHHMQSHQDQQMRDTKPRVTCKSLTNLLQPDLIPDQFKQADQSMKMSNLMTMPTFDLTSPPVSTTTTPTPTAQPKLKVKPGQHLLDPLAMQRRLFNTDDIPEVGSTTNGIEEMMSSNGLYHPLLNTQKNYTSPWQWTTVTATGE